MNDRDIDQMIADARALADRLEAREWRAEAALVRKLARSRAGARLTNRRLYADNLALRRQLANGGTP